MQHRFADAYVTDEGTLWRRAGIAVMGVGLTIGLLGIAILTLAADMWPGSLLRGVLALVGGIAAVAVGWSLLRHGDHLGPRLRPCAVSFRVAVAQPPTTRSRIYVPTLPFGALPRGG